MEKPRRNPKKFRPCRNYRYLLGLVTKDKAVADLIEYNRHRYEVFKATAFVDHHPLKMNPYNYINTRRLSEDTARYEQIEKQNKELLKKINKINRKGGWIDTYNPLAYRTVDKWGAHEQEMKRIDRDNKYIYQIILSAVYLTGPPEREWPALNSDANIAIKTECAIVRCAEFGSGQNSASDCGRLASYPHQYSYYNVALMEKKWKETLEKIKHSCKLPCIIMDKVSLDETLKACPSISEGLEEGNVDRPFCFLEFQVKNEKVLGRLVIELYYDHVPVTVQNFLEICKGDDLTYKNCVVHRIVKGKFLETGDITKGTGRGGFSIYGKTFQEENHMLKHTRMGIISMKRVGNTENNSQFCITFNKLEQLDHKNVVFGKVIKGNEILYKIQDYGRKVGKPYAEIIISNCGQIETAPPEQ